MYFQCLEGKSRDGYEHAVPMPWESLLVDWCQAPCDMEIPILLKVGLFKREEGIGLKCVNC